MENRYQATYHSSVTNFLRELPPKDRSKIEKNIKIMQAGDLLSPRIKTLRSPISELIVKEYRILFFIHENVIYFVRAFRKKSMKTPPKEIEYAERIYKLTTNA
ncbi:MAG: type II toxin-antitoxin system RelE/ParE family toxin [bacterium]|nr:type II toxin-antitoxin system RelE/ParE family toxin [bacterium]